MGSTRNARRSVGYGPQEGARTRLAFRPCSLERPARDAGLAIYSVLKTSLKYAGPVEGGTNADPR